MDIYSKKFSELDEEEVKALSFAVQTLRAGDTLWHTDESLWWWVLSFIKVVIEAESTTHPQVAMYVEYLKTDGKYGVSIIKNELPAHLM